MYLTPKYDENVNQNAINTQLDKVKKAISYRRRLNALWIVEFDSPLLISVCNAQTWPSQQPTFDEKRDILHGADSTQ